METTGDIDKDRDNLEDNCALLKRANARLEAIISKDKERIVESKRKAASKSREIWRGWASTSPVG